MSSRNLALRTLFAVGAILSAGMTEYHGVWWFTCGVCFTLFANTLRPGWYD